MADLHPFLKNLLRKDQPDSTPYALEVGVSTALTAAATRADLAGGAGRPFRNFVGVGSTETHANVRAGQSEVIMPVIDGQVYVITVIRITTKVAPTSNTTITIKNGSTVVYTVTMSVLNVPVVGKVLDLLGVAAAMPADQPTPCTFTVSATSGKFDVLVDGILL